MIIPLLTARELPSEILCPVSFSPPDPCFFRRNTEKPAGVHQSANEILQARNAKPEETTFLQPGQQKANWGATCCLPLAIKGTQTGRASLFSSMHSKTQGNGQNVQHRKTNQIEKKYTNKNAQARGWNCSLWKFSKLKWPWPTCPNFEVSSTYSSVQGQVTASGPLSAQVSHRFATQSTISCNARRVIKTGFVQK